MSEEQQAELEQENLSVDEAPATAEATEAEANLDAEAAPAPAAFVETDNENIKKRFGKLTADKHKALDTAKAEREARLKAEEELNALKLQPATPIPTLEDFDFDETKHSAALVAHQVDEVLSKRDAVNNRTQTILTQAEREQSFIQEASEYAAKPEAKGSDKTPSFEQAMAQLPVFPDDTYAMILGVKDSPRLVHYLGANPDVANQIAALDVGAAGMHIGTILSSISAPGATKRESSSAPEPIDPITQSGATQSDEWSNLAQGATFK